METTAREACSEVEGRVENPWMIERKIRKPVHDRMEGGTKGAEGEDRRASEGKGQTGGEGQKQR